MKRRIGDLFRAFGEYVDLRDLLCFGGIAMMGYGLYQFHPWIAFVVCGAVLAAIGLFKVPKGNV